MATRSEESDDAQPQGPGCPVAKFLAGNENGWWRRDARKGAELVDATHPVVYTF